MEGAYGDLLDWVRRPAVAETLIDVLLCAVPIWVAVMIGLVIGWSWRPRWTGLVFLGLRSKLRFLCTAPPGLGARRLWFAFTALSAFSVCRTLWTNFKGKGDGRGAAGKDDEVVGSSASSVSVGSSEPAMVATSQSSGSVDRILEDEEEIITEKDLEHLLHLLDGKGETWQHMMERTTSNFTYQAWRHEPEVGPVMYCSRTVFEDATPELVRDFFWDDDFRLKWDPMLAHFKVLEEFPHSGEMIVHWIKKFPFFCSDREYIIGRRIWESGKEYYCVTKGVPYPALRKKEKPRRVELYFSSWRIRAVESRKQDGQLSACEVALVHYEDMGIPKDVAKVGVRHGMWGAVKKLQSGMRAYQLSRKTDLPLSRTALMARNMSKIPALRTVCPSDSESSEVNVKDIDIHRKGEGIDWRWVCIGGTVAIVCGLQTGIVGKALLFGAARRLARK